MRVLCPHGLGAQNARVSPLLSFPLLPSYPAPSRHSRVGGNPPVLRLVASLTGAPAPRHIGPGSSWRSRVPCGWHIQIPAFAGMTDRGGGGMTRVCGAGCDVVDCGNPSGLFPERKGGYLCPGKWNGTAILTEYAELCKN